MGDSCPRSRGFDSTIRLARSDLHPGSEEALLINSGTSCILYGSAKL
jgi:hypothetical protein